MNSLLTDCRYQGIKSFGVRLRHNLKSLKKHRWANNDWENLEVAVFLKQIPTTQVQVYKLRYAEQSSDCGLLLEK